MFRDCNGDRKPFIMSYLFSEFPRNFSLSLSFSLEFNQNHIIGKRQRRERNFVSLSGVLFSPLLLFYIKLHILFYSMSFHLAPQLRTLMKHKVRHDGERAKKIENFLENFVVARLEACGLYGGFVATSMPSPLCSEIHSRKIHECSMEISTPAVSSIAHNIIGTGLNHCKTI